MTDATDNPNATILAALSASAEKQQRLAESIFGPAEPADPDQDPGDE